MNGRCVTTMRARDALIAAVVEGASRGREARLLVGISTLRLAALAVTLAVLAACGEEQVTGDDAGESETADATGAGSTGADGEDGPPAECGNGVVERGEFCDDGSGGSCTKCPIDEVARTWWIQGEVPLLRNVQSVASGVGDLDGDGRSDLVVSFRPQPESEQGEYSAAIFLGRGLADAPTQEPLGLERATFVLPGVLRRTSLRIIPDLDGDGTDELLLFGDEALTGGIAMMFRGASLAQVPDGTSNPLASADVFFPDANVACLPYGPLWSF